MCSSFLKTDRLMMVFFRLHMSENSFIYMVIAVILDLKFSMENRMLKDQNQTHSSGSFYFLVVFNSFILQVFMFSRLNSSFFYRMMF